MADELTAGTDADARAGVHAFTGGLGNRWLREFSWSQDVLEEIGMESRSGGARALQRGRHLISAQKHSSAVNR